MSNDVVRFILDRKRLHGGSPSAAAAAVITFITSVRDTSKQIVREIWAGWIDLKSPQTNSGETK